ncbi:PAS domain S-box protein [Clostridium chromiireducens]|uniref:PAS domain S-box protein n=1 Tax=Clostridium chromiireducens TaxID=225345 RepID=UPI003AF7CC0D
MYEGKEKALILDEDVKLNETSYKEIWDKINELAFVIELDKEFTPVYFVDFNNKFCSDLGYSKDELRNVLPSDILKGDNWKDKAGIFRKLIYQKSINKIELILRTKDKKSIFVESDISIFSKGEKNFALIIAMDITERKKLEKELKGILNGIPDVIKVYNTDYTISFFNEAGYNFYKKMPEEVNGKMCYEILARKEKCVDCSFEEVIETKEMLSRERYIPELNKFMDVCYNPVMGEDGELLFIVERLRDITEKKILDKILKDSKERYKQIINSSPEAVVIIVDNKIVLANNETCNIFGISYNELIGSNVYNRFQEKYKKALHKRFRTIITEKRIKDVYDYEFYLSNNKLVNLQISYSYILYEGKAAIIAVIRDITEMKQEIRKAAEFQKNTLQNTFPAQKFINTTSVYVPGNTISGDFYRIYEINESRILGIITDVRGKGISAALNISAFDVLCSQEVAKVHEPMDIVKNLNEKLTKYYEENYIAICCFSIDFNKNELKVVGAGINQFLFQKKGQGIEEKIVEGTFLGMFENSEFCEQILSFESGDKVFFFTDGLDFILDEDRIIQEYMGDASIFEFKNYLDGFLSDSILDAGKLKDDCTMVAMEVK